MNNTDILATIPHRAPFLFVDRVLDLDERKIRAEKYLSPDLDFFKGHYPDFPIMPGALTCESIFQAGAILLAQYVENNSSGVPAVTRIRDAKFKKMVRPGDTLLLETELEERVGPAFYMKGRATVGDKLVASVSFTCAMVDPQGA